MTETAELPRVLVVAVNPINRVQSNGMLMGSLFEGWPKDRIAQIYFPFFHDFAPDGSVCQRYLRVNPIGLTKEEIGEPDPEAAAREYGPLASRFRTLVRSRELKKKLLDPLRETLNASSRVEREVLAFSRSFRPDLVYTLLGTIGVARMTAKIAEETGCPVVPHFTDHWIETRFVGAPFEGALRGRLRHWLDRVLERSPLILTVSRGMAERYADRFERECHAFTSVVDKEPYLRADELRVPEGGPVRLRYAGNLGLDRWRTLALLGGVLRRLKADGIDVRLEIYCSEEDRLLYRRELEIPEIVEMRGWVAPSRLPELLTEADVLVHVESPDPATLQYTRFSLSTKITDYMMAGRCLLLVGPPEAGSMAEVERLDAGVVVPVTDPDALERAVRRVLTDSAFRTEMGRKARSAALEAYEANSQRALFREVLQKAHHLGPVGARGTGHG